MLSESLKHYVPILALTLLLPIALPVSTQNVEQKTDTKTAQTTQQPPESEPQRDAQKNTASSKSGSVSVNDLLLSLLIVAGALIAAFLVHRLFSWLGEKARKSSYNIDGLMLKILGPPLSVLVATLPILYALKRIPAVQERFDQWKGAEKALLILIGTWLLASLVKKLINHYGMPLAQKTHTTIDERLVHILDMTAVYIIWILGILVALRTLGIKVTAFLASMGIAGLAVALAAKTVLSNMLGGITLTADPYLNLGDRIEIGDFIGDVVNINLYKTTIRTRDNKIVSIPNDVLVKEVVINHELPESRTRLSLPFGVSYNSDLDRVTDVMRNIIEQEENILDEPAPEVNLTEFGGSSVNFNVLVWINAPRGRRTVKDRVYRKIFKRFNELDIEIPFPQRVIHQNAND